MRIEFDISTVGVNVNRRSTSRLYSKITQKIVGRCSFSIQYLVKIRDSNWSARQLLSVTECQLVYSSHLCIPAPTPLYIHSIEWRPTINHRFLDPLHFWNYSLHLSMASLTLNTIALRFMSQWMLNGVDEPGSFCS